MEDQSTQTFPWEMIKVCKEDKFYIIQTRSIHKCLLGQISPLQIDSFIHRMAQLDILYTASKENFHLQW